MCMASSIAMWGQTYSDDGTAVTVDLATTRLSTVTNTDNITSLTLQSSKKDANGNYLGMTYEDAKYLHDNFANLENLDMTSMNVVESNGSETLSANIVNGVNSSKEKTTVKINYTLSCTGRTLPQGLFIGKTKLKTVKLPNSGANNQTLNVIGNYAFAGCTALESIDLGDNANFQGLNVGVFLGCTSLNSIDFSKFTYNFQSIGNSAFEYCTSLTSVIFPTVNGRLYQTQGYRKGLAIGSSAFKSCTSLKSISFPDYVSSIGSSALMMCSNLSNVTLPDTTAFTTISSAVFERDSKLATINIPASVTNIEAGAFGATGLTTMTVNSAVPAVCNIKSSYPFLSVRNNRFNLIFANDAIGHEAEYSKADGFNYLMSRTLTEEDNTLGAQVKDDGGTWDYGAIQSGKNLNVYLVRTFTEGWNTLVVPFSASSDVVKKALGENVKVAKLSSINGNNLIFTYIDDCSIPENTPVIVSGISIPEKTNIPYDGSYVDKANAYAFEGVDISNIYRGNAAVNALTVGNVKMNGSFVKKDNISLTNGFFLQNGNLYAAESGNTYNTKGFRAWFETTTGSAAKNMTFSVSNGTVTSISKIEIDKADNGKIYDLQGREVTKPVKGIYIKNGRKFIVK